MNSEIVQIIKEFKSNVLLQKECISKCDAESGNRAADKYIDCWNKIHKAGDSAKEEFSTLLEHENVDIRVTAACFLLKYKHEVASAVLRDIANMDTKGMASFEAEQCLMRWEEGTWALDE